jgi:NADH-quinone oxidoreductase subunit N
MWIDEPDEPREIERYPTSLYVAIVAAAVVTVALLPGILVFDSAAFDAAAALL